MRVLDLVKHRHEASDAVDDEMRADAEQLGLGPRPQRGLLLRRGRRPFLGREADAIARDADAHGPGAGGEALQNARLGIVDLHHGGGRIDAEIGEAAIHHQRRRPPVGEVSGADEVVRLVALGGGERQHALHDRADIARGGAELHAARPHPRRHLDRAGDEGAEIRHHLGIERHEDVIQGVDLGLARRRAMGGGPARGDCRLGHQRGDMGAFRQAHGPPRLGHRDRHVEAAIGFDEGAHRRAGAEVDHGSGPVENGRAEMSGHAQSSWMTSSPMAKEVEAPVPLVTTTSRTRSMGVSISTSRSCAAA